MNTLTELSKSSKQINSLNYLSFDKTIHSFSSSPSHEEIQHLIPTLAVNTAEYLLRIGLAQINQSSQITHILTSRTHLLPSLTKTINQLQLNINSLTMLYPQTVLFIITNEKISVCLPSSYLPTTIFDKLYDVMWTPNNEFVRVKNSCINSIYDVLITIAVDTQNTDLLLSILRYYNMSTTEFDILQKGFAQIIAKPTLNCFSQNNHTHTENTTL